MHTEANERPFKKKQEMNQYLQSVCIQYMCITAFACLSKKHATLILTFYVAAYWPKSFLQWKNMELFSPILSYKVKLVNPIASYK